jgi:voltage-gated potassium channel
MANGRELGLLPRSTSAERRWALLIILPPTLVLIGTLGYHWLENLSYFDALYLSVITLTTVGYGDVVAHTTGGRVFTMLFVSVGVFLLFYTATTIIAAVVSGEVQRAAGKKAMEHLREKLKHHIIVCGFGRMGRLICQELAHQKLSFVVIEKQAALLENFALPGGVPLAGDATSDDVLKSAHVERARGLIAVVSSDADNLFITMSARLLNDKLCIIARAEDETAESKLLRAGATRAISAHKIGGARIAQAILRPTVVDFIELATKTTHLDLQLEETTIQPASRLVGKSLRESHLRRELGLIIVAIKKPTGKMAFNPSSETMIEANDTLIVLGDRQKLDELLAVARGEAQA